jgi:hypothetical protein
MEGARRMATGAWRANVAWPPASFAVSGATTLSPLPLFLLFSNSNRRHSQGTVVSVKDTPLDRLQLLFGRASTVSTTLSVPPPDNPTTLNSAATACPSVSTACDRCHTSLTPLPSLGHVCRGHALVRPIARKGFRIHNACHSL